MTNPYIIAPLATWLVAQLAKFMLAALRGRVDFRYLYASGGMPSVHSAVVSSLATTAFLVDGPNSHLFGLTAVLAVIVMYDSFGVRRSAGEQAVALNVLISSIDKGRIRSDHPDLRIREVLGHQPDEVTVGAILGVVLAMIFSYDHLGPLTGFLQAVPAGVELWIWLILFGVVALGGLVTKFALGQLYPKSRTIRLLGRRVLVVTQVTGWLGVLIAIFEYERTSYLALRLWPILLLVVALTWAAAIFKQSYSSVPAALAAEQSQARKLKWLNFASRKKRQKKR